MLNTSPFFVNTSLLDWNTASKRYAGVSSFGMGGTNSHLILSEYQPKEQNYCKESLKEELIFVSAKTKKALQQSVNKLTNYFIGINN